MLDKLYLQPMEYYVSLLSILAFQKENGIAINLPVIYDSNNGVIFKILQEHSKIYLAHIPLFHDLILSKGVNIIMADSKLKMYGGQKIFFSCSDHHYCEEWVVKTQIHHGFTISID